MPYVNIKITKPGVTADHKRALVAGVTKLLQDTLGKNPEHTHIVIDLVEEENWGYAGELTSTLRGSDAAS
ncbi:MAG: 4-oxalocrotonate tautomerase family protein [Planctomycetota bacterium]